jgi:hypothetical protein
VPEPLTAGGSRPAPIPAAPLALEAAPEHHHSWMRALLISGLVLLAGTVLGAGGFVFEQSRATWRPQVTATDHGWRISTSHGLRLGGASLSADHLAWDAGPFTLLTDLRSGRSKLLGVAATMGDAPAPSLSDSFAVWLQAPTAGPSGAVVWTYEIAHGRRARLAGVHGVSQSPAVSGTMVVWEAFTGTGTQRIFGADLVTGRRFSLGESDGASQLIISGTLVAWAGPRPGTAEPPVITVVDLTDGRRWHLAPYAGEKGVDLVWMTLAGRTLVWARTAAAGTTVQILAYDLEQGTVRMLAQGAGLLGPAADGDLVVWAQTSSGGGTRIIGLRLSRGDPFTVAAVSGGRVQEVFASRETCAWSVAGDYVYDSYLQTARLP